MKTLHFKVVARFSPLIFLIFAACGPAAGATTPVDVLAVPMEAPVTSTAVSATSTIEVTPSPASTPEEQTILPYYLPLVTQPDNASQTIGNVTTQIDWVYVDESRVALHFTISGLDWPDGTT